MNTYIILPDKVVFARYKQYLQQVIGFVSRQKKIALVASADFMRPFNRKTGVIIYSASDFYSQSHENSIIFDFSEDGYRVDCRHYFNLDLSTLDCCLYSCLIIKNAVDLPTIKTDYPAELLSRLWYEIVFKPDLSLMDYVNKQKRPPILTMEMPSEQRARLAHHGLDLKADSLPSALEAILLGKPIGYPGRLSNYDNLRGYMLASQLIPASVFTHESAFNEFLRALSAPECEILISDTLLQLHHESLLNDPAFVKANARFKKLRKFKRDPIVFFKDAVKNLIN